MRLQDYERGFEERPFWTLGRVMFSLVVVLMVIGGFISVVNFVTNPVRQAARVINKTIDADNVIYNYEWFHRQHGDILAMEPKINEAALQLEAFQISAGPRTDWEFDDKQEHARLSSILLGLRNQRSEMVQRYNAHAEMSNRSIFIGRDLPTHIN